MCLYLHSHWEPIRLQNPNALCKCCWMLCILCSSSYRGACFQFVPLVRHQSSYFDTLSGIFHKCNSANAFWTRYLETVIGWRFRIVQQSAQTSYMAVFIIVPPKQWDGQICQRLIFTVEPARWRRTCERPNSTNSKHLCLCFQFFTRGQFWPSGIVIAPVCVSVCVCVCINHLLVRTITHQPFKLESPNLKHKCKTPWLRSLLFWGVIDLELQGQI